MKTFQTLAFTLVAVFAAFAPFDRARAAGGQEGTWPAICSGVTADTMYSSQVFDSGISRSQRIVDSGPLAAEFAEFLRGMLGSAPGQGFCNILQSAAEAEPTKKRAAAQLGRPNLRFVEVTWNAVPRHGAADAVRDRVFCVPAGDSGSAYYTNRPAANSSVNLSQWQNGFAQALARTYSVKGGASCNLLSARMASAWLDGARSANKKVVDTGWQLDASAAPAPTTSRPNTTAEPDDDRVRPRPAPSSQPVSLQARAVAIKEVPAATAYCENDKMMSGAFDCHCLQGKVYAYRMEHAADTVGPSPEPLASLFTNNKLECAACIKQFVQMWARSQAQSQGRVTPAAADCVSQKFVTLIRATPHPSEVQPIFTQAMQACK